MDAFAPGAATRPVTKLEISICCKNLVNKDLLSKSDPFVAVFQAFSNGRQRNEVGRTETINDNLNPVFEKKFLIDYFFEERQVLEFHVFDSDSESRRLEDHDFLGAAQMALGEIVSAPDSLLQRPLTGLGSATKASSTIAVRADEISDSRDAVEIIMRGTKLDKKDFFGKSDPFVNIYRANEGKEWTLVKRTEVIKNTLNPSWKPFEISMDALCKGDMDRAIKFVVFDWNNDGSEDLIGEFQTTVKEVTGFESHAPAKTSFDVINAAKQQKKGSKYKNSGTVSISAVVKKRFSFLEYIRGGTDLNFTVAIDFTASNGAPSDPRSLHFRDPMGPNQYQQATRAVGEIIQDYDADKLFPALGFGAKLPPDGKVSHEFFLNFHPSNPHCAMVEGIMAAYQYTLGSVQLYGPTNFAPVINHVARIASNDQSGENYYVLLIVTDGVITDFSNTVSSIIAASYLPMSIIIVGVGDADFEAMDDLDADNSLLADGRNKAQRDIVQFVPYRDFMKGQDFGANQARLAKAVLEELPDQLTKYMELKGIKPGSGRRPASQAPPPAPSLPNAPGHPQQSQPPNPFLSNAPYLTSAPSAPPPYASSTGNSALPYPTYPSHPYPP